MQINGTKLYQDFIAKSDKIHKFLKTESPSAIASQLQTDNIDRNELVDILQNQNEQFGCGPRTIDSLKKLRDTKTLCVFGGQQAGILGGPLLTIYKLIDVVKRAALLEEELRQPVIPVFWIAGDDHDFDEINHTYTINQENESEKIVLNIESAGDSSVAQLFIEDDDNYSAFKKTIEDNFGGTDFSDNLINSIFDSYSPGTDLVTAFARFMFKILPDTGVILLNPFDKKLKELSKEFFKQVIERHFLIRTALDETEEALLSDGYHIQAEKKETAVHLFYHNPERVPVHYIDDIFVMGDKKLGLPALLDLIERNPEKFSAGVLTRPILQSYLFPTVLQIGGPSEIAYFCQIGKLFDLFKLPQPYYNIRTGATFIEKRPHELMQKYNITIDDLTGDIEEVINRIAQETFPNDIQTAINKYKTNHKSEYDKLAAIISEYDDSLDHMIEHTYGKIDYTFGNLENKIFTRHKKQIKSIREQIYKIGNLLYPERNLQERHLNIAYFISKYGPGVVKFLGRKLDVNSNEHQMIDIAEYTD